MSTIGTIVREWREANRIKVADLAKEVGTSRQNLENLEKDEVSQPRYLRALARRMGYAKVEDLVDLKAPPAKAGGVVALIDTSALVAMAQHPDLAHAVDYIASLVELQDDATREAAAAAFAGLFKDPKNERLKLALLTLLGENVDAAATAAGGARPARSSGKRPRGGQR